MMASIEESIFKYINRCVKATVITSVFRGVEDVIENTQLRPRAVSDTIQQKNDH